MQSIKNIFHLLMGITAGLLYGFPGRKMTVIGITGTDGKTTTTHLLYHILKTAKLPVSFVSTIEANIMGKTFDTGFHVTTPSPFQLQKLIKLAFDKGTKYLILEITSHALDQYRHFGSSIDIALINNISHEHLDYHKNLKNYMAAKARIVRGARITVLNRDDQSYSFLNKKVKNKKITFSLKTKNALNKISSQGNQHLLGIYNQYNILAVSTIADLLKIKHSIIQKAVKSYNGIPGRLERIKNNKQMNIYIDFAHKINALDNVLMTLKKISKKKLIAVFGSAGLRDTAKRPLMGKVAARNADYIILTAEDPRTEDVRDIIDSIALGCKEAKAVLLDKSDGLNGIKNGKKYFFKIPDRQEAINFAIRKLAKKGDTVVFCGKGHEKSMCYGRIEYPWDEKKAIEKALYASV